MLNIQIQIGRLIRQFSSDEFNRWCKYNLSTSQRRRSNCWDNALAESFFRNLKNEQIWERIDSTLAKAKSEIFDYIEGYYNRVRCHKPPDQLSPCELERQRQTAIKKLSMNLGQRHSRMKICWRSS